MAIKCEFCTGTHYLSDNAALGPCVCCTPEALTAAERMIGDMASRAAADAARPQEPTDVVEMLDLMESTLNTVRERCAVREERQRAIAPALADYMVSIGLDAVPVGDIRDAELRELYEKVTGDE